MKWLVAMVLAFPMMSAAQDRELDPAYLGTLPTTERVMAEIQGSDATDTAARQAAAFWILRRVIAVMSDGRDGRNALTADEQGVIRYYTDARNGIIDRFDPLPTAERNAFYGPMTRNENNDEFRLEVLRRFVRPVIANRYLDEIAADGPRLEGAGTGQAFGGWWEGMPGTRRVFFLVAIASAALVVFAMARERRPFGFEPDNPRKLRSGWRGKATLFQHSWDDPEFTRSDEFAGQMGGSRVKEILLTVKTEFESPAGDKFQTVHLHLQFEGAAPHVELLTTTALVESDPEHPSVLTLRDENDRLLHQNLSPAHGFLAPWRWPAFATGFGLFCFAMTGLLGQDDILFKALVAGGMGLCVALFLQARARKRRFTAFEAGLETLDAAHVEEARQSRMRKEAAVRSS